MTDHKKPFKFTHFSIYQILKVWQLIYHSNLTLKQSIIQKFSVWHFASQKWTYQRGFANHGVGLIK